MKVLLPCLAVDCNPPLPNELLSFTGKNLGEINILQWQTTSESDKGYFIVERSIDGNSFESIGKVEGAGNSAQVFSYSFQDEAPAKGINYYRLKQTGQNGQSAYSNVITVERQDLYSESIKLSPNPVLSGVPLHVSCRLPEGQAACIKLYNILGMETYNVSDLQGSIDVNINTAGFPPGIYFLTLTSGGKSERARIVIK